MTAKSSEVSPEIERLLPAARAVVFRAFSDPGDLAKWWGAVGLHDPEPRIQPPRRSGLPHRDAAAGSDPFHLSGEFREVDPPARHGWTESLKKLVQFISQP